MCLALFRPFLQSISLQAGLANEITKLNKFPDLIAALDTSVHQILQGQVMYVGDHDYHIVQLIRFSVFEYNRDLCSAYKYKNLYQPTDPAAYTLLTAVLGIKWNLLTQDLKWLLGLAPDPLESRIKIRTQRPSTVDREGLLLQAKTLRYFKVAFLECPKVFHEAFSIGSDGPHTRLPNIGMINVLIDYVDSGSCRSILTISGPSVASVLRKRLSKKRNTYSHLSTPPVTATSEELKIWHSIHILQEVLTLFVDHHCDVLSEIGGILEVMVSVHRPGESRKLLDALNMLARYYKRYKYR